MTGHKIDAEALIRDTNLGCGLALHRYDPIDLDVTDVEAVEAEL